MRIETMNWNRLKLPAAAAVIVAIVVQHRIISDLRDKNQSLATRANQAVAAPSESEELDRLRRELEKQKKLAAEVHELRARLAELQRTSDSAAKTLAALDRENARLKSNMATAAENNTNALDEAKEQEKEYFRVRMNQMKHLGLAYHNWAAKNPNTPPQNLRELAESQGIIDEAAIRELEARCLLILHPVGTPPRDDSHPVVIAERLPTRTLEGNQIWLYTMLDGSVRTSATPLTEDGFLPNESLR